MHCLRPLAHMGWCASSMEDFIARDCSLLRGRKRSAFPRTSCGEQWQTGARGGFTEVSFDAERLACASVCTGLW
eukprot:8287100-Pyramimonas_sp.AAC.1